MLGIALVAVVLAASACSDAHTQAQLTLSDNGSDPHEVTLLAPNAADVWLHKLTDAYRVLHPEVTFVYELQVTVTPQRPRAKPTPPIAPQKRVAAGDTPDVWIDEYGILRDHASDPRVQDPPFRVGNDPFEFVVQAGNPQNVTGLEVFGPGNHPKSGLCNLANICGSLARGILLKGGIDPKADVTYADGPTLAGAVAEGKVAAGMMFTTEAAAQAPSLTRLAAPRTFIYGAMAMRADPVAAKFLAWLKSSPDARAVLTSAGLQPPPGT